VSPSKAAKAAAKTTKATKAAASKSKGGAASRQPPRTAPAGGGGRGAADIARTSGRAAGSAGGNVPRLKARYRDEVQARLKEELELRNVMEVPRLDKIVVNMGVGRATQQVSLIEGAQRDIEVITGQKSVVTRAKKSIAGFKLRAGMPIGVRVTLRGDRAWEFLDRLISLAIPRVRDFRGLSPRSFDGHGNYTFGVNEQLIFPEVDYDRIDTVRGMDITIVTTARTDDEGRAFLRSFGFPFRQETR
jgi:large subunit ribosomal protein L5